MQPATHTVSNTATQRPGFPRVLVLYTNSGPPSSACASHKLGSALECNLPFQPLARVFLGRPFAFFYGAGGSGGARRRGRGRGGGTSALSPMAICVGTAAAAS